MSQQVVDFLSLLIMGKNERKLSSCLDLVEEVNRMIMVACNVLSLVGDVVASFFSKTLCKILLYSHILHWISYLLCSSHNWSSVLAQASVVLQLLMQNLQIQAFHRPVLALQTQAARYDCI